jgi:membrane fusion protein, multidrug efflux system
VREVAASSDPVTRTYPVKVSMDAKAPPPLGATVYVTVEAGVPAGAPVIKLPSSALRREGQATTVWVLDKAAMTVRQQVIQVATADGNEVVVASGLEPGMLVVSAGVHVLSPGQKVTIYQSNVPVAQAVPAQAATNLIAKPAPAASAVPAASASVAK